MADRRSLDLVRQMMRARRDVAAAMQPAMSHKTRRAMAKATSAKSTAPPAPSA